MREVRVRGGYRFELDSLTQISLDMQLGESFPKYEHFRANGLTTAGLCSKNLNFSFLKSKLFVTKIITHGTQV